MWLHYRALHGVGVWSVVRVGAQRVHGTENGCFGAGNVISGCCCGCCCGGGCAAHGPLNTNVHTSSLGLSVQEGVAVMVRHHGLLLLGHIPEIQSSRIKTFVYLRAKNSQMFDSIKWKIYSESKSLTHSLNHSLTHSSRRCPRTFQIYN